MANEQSIIHLEAMFELKVDYMALIGMIAVQIMI